MPREIRRSGEDEVRRRRGGVRRAGSSTGSGAEREGARLKIYAEDEEVTSARGVARRAGVGNQAEARLEDAPLIAEDLLCQARQLADSGAPTKAVKVILDHVAALREGRG